MSDSNNQKSYEGPIVKRQKLSDSTDLSKPSLKGSRIFTPFRTIGLVSPTSVPFTSIPLGKTTFQITTSVGKCLQTYDLKRGLQLIFITRPQTPENITATTAWKDRIFAAWGEADSACGIWVFKRGKKVAELEIPSDMHETIKQILIFGTWIIGCCTTRIEVWKSSDYEHYTTLFSTAAPNGGNELTGGIISMPTYLNKIFAGRSDGCVEIWNVSSGKLLFTILPLVAKCGAITALKATPALSILAIAYHKGPLVMYDIRTDRAIIQLDGGSSPIKSISFRSDELGAGNDGQKSGVMATAGPNHGDIVLWDLNDGGRVMGILRGAHNAPPESCASVGGGVSKIEFLPGQSVLVTSGLDNSLKTWVFDETPFSPIPRILHSRSGHAAPITRLLFLPSDFDSAESAGKWLLSTSIDRSLWGWSLRRDGQSIELSQGNTRKKSKKLGLVGSSTITESRGTLSDLKAPEIIGIAASMNRDGGMGASPGNGAIWQKNNRGKQSSDATASSTTGWESVVTAHKNDRFARTWFWGRKKAGRWIFETGDGSNVTSVTISPCGTFAVIGSELGIIDTFNLQSGLHRQRYPAKLSQSQAKKLQLELSIINQGNGNGSKQRFRAGLGKHKKAVTGLVVDSLGRGIISCSLDGKVKFWDFQSGQLVHELECCPSTAISGMRYHNPSDLIALSCDDLAIRVVDIETKKFIRELWGNSERVNDFCFSNDGRWIIAASSDCVIRVWDLPTGHLIDAIRTKFQCTALAFSSTGEFLATACEGILGVDLWNNKTLFTHAPTQNISEDNIAELDGPTVSGEGGHNLIDEAFEDQELEIVESVPSLSPEQLSKDMQTLSLVPKSRWQNLLYLDVIKARNKPTEAPKVPEKAPFFLPSLNTIPLLPSKDEKATDTIAEESRVKKLGRLTSESLFTITLRAVRESGDYTPFIRHLQSLSPSAADLEIRSLNPTEEFIPFIKALTLRLRDKRDYELIQAWMSVFLRLHIDSFSHDPIILETLKLWRIEQEKEGKRIGELLGYCNGVVSFLKNGR
ncbi:BgTH12-04430 [Blumeria graminis f. sp. triticale]|uniref:BgtA-20015 n=3 Tax=Blumeria graminis TaxID=34373 RepID=A0A9X9PQM2_BLUGR|nr:hypothetical protein BGT96224_A20015 [Blumeria graminis f. sp. tritici 96224]CAD6498770.1 BgTH12-04430 [Blumeria graminis f. sp. triticale]VCU38885.1 BgtA-20015 [Blumeria graminis f. sp. tritici]